MRDDDDDDATTKRRRRSTTRPSSSRDTRRPRADGGMRIVVPLQGVVQGRGGLVLGSLIPCALLYFLQLYLKRNRPPGSPTATGSSISARGAVVRAGDEDSLYYAGIRRCADDLYHPDSNPAGIINLGLAENHLSLDLVGRWMEEHAGAAMLEGMTGADEERDLTVRGLATYQPYDGILALKMT